MHGGDRLPPPALPSRSTTTARAELLTGGSRAVPVGFSAHGTCVYVQTRQIMKRGPWRDRTTREQNKEAQRQEKREKNGEETGQEEQMKKMTGWAN